MRKETKETPFWLWPAIFVGVGLITLATFLVIGQVNPEAFEDDEPLDPYENVQPINTEDIDLNDLTTVERHDEEDPVAIGEVNAPVTMVMFSDYQCGFCAAWSHDTLPVLKEEFVDSGDLRIEWRDANIYGEASENGARAAYAAGLQDGFQDYQQLLYPDGEILSEDALSENNLVELAGTAGLDVEQFASDYNSSDVLAGVQRNQSIASYLQVYSTPMFIIGGETVVGAQPTEVFTELVENKISG